MLWTVQKLNGEDFALCADQGVVSLSNQWPCARASCWVLKAQFRFSFKKENNTLKKLKAELWILPSCGADQAQSKGGEARSTYAPPKCVWEVDGRLDNKEESSPLAHLTLPKCPFPSPLWLNEETLTLWAGSRDKTSKAVAGSASISQLAPLQAVTGEPAFRIRLSLLTGQSCDHLQSQCAFLLKPS